MIQLPAPPASSITLESIAMTFCGVVLLWLVKVTIEGRDEIRELKTSLFGINGDNGINGTVKGMKAELDEIKETVTACQASHGLRGHHE